MKTNHNRIPEIYLPVTLFLIAFVWKFLYIGERDICIDEPYTIYNAQRTLMGILQLPAQNEPHPPLFMIIVHYWIKIFGISPYSVRSIPIFFNALTVPFLYMTGKKFFNVWVGIIASGLFIFSTNHFFFGSDTRAYSMLSCATAASMYFYFSIVNGSVKKIVLTGLIIANFFLVYSHYFGWFVIFVQFLSSFLYLKEKQGIKKLWISFITTGILYLPMAKIMIKQFFSSSKGTWLSPPAKSEYINQLMWFLNSKTVSKSVIIVLVAGIIAAFLLKTKIKHWRLMATLVIWWFIPYSIMFLVSEKIPMFTNRYILFNSIGFYLFLGAGIFVLYRKLKYAVPVIGLLLLTFTFTKISTKNFAVREIKQSADYIRSKADENSMIYIYPQWANLGLNYYYVPEIFRNEDQYYNLLKKNKIFPLWSVADAKNNIKNTEHTKIIYYQNNATFIDPDNKIYHYLDSTYTVKDSASFPGGLLVTVFEKNNN